MNPPDTDERKKWTRTLRHSVEVSDKKWLTTLLLSAFLGFTGADRFYIGCPIIGFLKFCTGGGGALWWLGDLAWLLLGKMKDGDDRFIRRPS